jgi:tetratricopeptide (TPR) repeat protein
MSRFLPLTLLAASLLSTSLANGQTASSTADELFARGVERHQSGDILGAIEAYREALEQEPGRIDARSNLGAAYVRLGRYGDAVVEYRKALEADDSQVKVRFNLALALYKSALIPEAAAELEKVVAADPQNNAALLLLADCQLGLGQDARVVTLLTPHEAGLGEDRLFSYLLGSALLRRNELLRGQQLIDRLFRGGDTAEGHLLLSVAHLQRQDSKSALPELERAIALNQALPTVQSLYGRALMNLGRRADATVAFRKELENNPNDFDSNLYLGLLLKDDNLLDESFDHLKRAARMRPQDSRVLYGLGSLHLAAGRVEEAQLALEAVTAQVPDYLQAHVLLATVYYRQKKKELGDRERTTADKLKEKQQAQEPGSREDLGPAYRGQDLPEAPPAGGGGPGPGVGPGTDR